MISRFFLLLTITFLLDAGNFSKSFGRGDVVKFAIPRLPVFYTGAKRVAVQVEDLPAGLPAQLLGTAIEQRLATDFAITPSNPELTIRVRAFFEIPKSEITVRTEPTKVQTGTKPATDPNGNPILNAAGQQMVEPVYETRDVALEVWQGSGRLMDFLPRRLTPSESSYPLMVTRKSTATRFRMRLKLQNSLYLPSRMPFSPAIAGRKRFVKSGWRSEKSCVQGMNWPKWANGPKRLKHG